MKLTKIIFGLCTFLLIVNTSLAFVRTTHEIATVGRIVGNTPADLEKQLEITTLDLGHVTYYSNDKGSGLKAWILAKTFPDNNDLHRHYSGWLWNDVKNSVNSFGNNNEFFIIETDGGIENNKLIARRFDSNLYPYNISSWKQNLKNTLFIFHSDYAGLALPNIDSFINRLMPIPAIIAPNYATPTYTTNKEFVKAFICNLAYYSYDSRSNCLGCKHTLLSKVYRNARNNYWYSDNPAGLSLMSYELYGNPFLPVSVPWPPDYDIIAIKNACEGYLKDYDLEEQTQKGLETSSLKTLSLNTLSLQESVTHDFYTKQLSFQIDNYDIIQQDNFSLLTTNKTDLLYIFNELVLPITTKITEFPLRTLITNISLDSLSEPVDLTINDLPMWDGDELINRTCYYENKSAGISYSYTFTEDKELVIIKIYPVEVMNCSEGKIRLYKKIDYSIKYIPYSPIIIKNINAPKEVLPNEKIYVNISIENIQSSPVYGNLTIKDKEDIIVKKEVFTNKNNFNLEFFAPTKEETKDYRLEFIQNEDIKTYSDFSIKISMLDHNLIVPEIVKDSAKIKLELFNKLDSNLNVSLNFYLMKNQSIINSTLLNKILHSGYNAINITFYNLKREYQTYDLVIDLIYNTKKTVSGTIITNHPPILKHIEDIRVNEGENVTITPMAEDIDNDVLTYTISEPVGNDGKWQTKKGDAGNYTTSITVTDGELIDSQDVKITVLELPMLFNLSLNSGWNLISIPLKLENTSITSIFKNINFSSIFSYGSWYYYFNETHNNFNKINSTMGLWINSLNNQTLIIEGTEFTYPINFSLKQGHNLISYPSLNPNLTNESLKNINFTSVYTYKNNKWYSYYKNRDNSLNKLKNLTPGYAYWINIPNNMNITFNGTHFN